MDFLRFTQELLNPINPYDIPIDVSIIGVLGLFVNKVRNPRHVDALIVTHEVVRGLWKNGSKFLYSYTLHNEEHALTLIRQSIGLMRVIDYLQIKKEDYFVLFLSCYLHDISMVLHPNLSEFNCHTVSTDRLATEFCSEIGNVIRKNGVLRPELFKETMIHIFNDVYDYFENKIRGEHPQKSAEFIKRQRKEYFAYIDKAIMQLVADVSESHGYDTVEVYGRKSRAEGNLHNLKSLMILIRLADLMDMTKERVNYYLLKQNIMSLSEVSQFHWISHLITNDVKLDAEYELNPNNQEPPIIEKILFQICLNTEIAVAFSNTKKCRGCNFQEPFNLSIQDENARCTKASCTFMCYWMHKKHNYLFAELTALKEFLNIVDNVLFLSINYLLLLSCSSPHIDLIHFVVLVCG